jgi:hypothetical protein
VANDTVTIFFKADGDTDLINALKNLSNAEKGLVREGFKVANAQKAVTNKLRTLSTAAKRQGTTLAKLAGGHKLLGAAARGSGIAMRKLEAQVKSTTKANEKLGGSGRGGLLSISNRGRLLSNTFATLRSKLLLASFAIGGVVIALNRFFSLTSKVAQINTMEIGFLNLGRQFGFNERSLIKLNRAIDGTVSEFDLLQQANNALLLGIVDSDDEMAQLFDTAQRLAKAVGQDARFGIESLVTGLGRQSRLMLDNLGLIVKTEKAYKDYAKTLGIAVSLLTDEEKKRAFVIAGIEQARQKVEQLGEEHLDSADIAKSATVSMEQAWLDFASAVEPSVTHMLTDWAFIIKRMGDTLDSGAIAKGGKELSNLSSRLGGLQAVLQETKDKQASSFIPGWSGYQDTIDEVSRRIAHLIVLQQELIFQEEERARLQRATVDYSGETLDVDAELVRVQALLAETYLKTNEFKINELETTLALIESKILSSELTEAEAAAYQHLADQLARYRKIQKDTTTGNNVANTSFRDSSRAVVSLAGSLEVLAKGNKQQTIAALRLAQAAAIGDAIAGSMRAFAKDGIAGFIAGTAALVAGLARVQQINAQIAQANSIPVAEQGGLIGGRRHSQGGTLIEAEQGEFILSRDAVASIGLETVNRLNQGGQASSGITINGDIYGFDDFRDKVLQANKVNGMGLA